jgi:putative transposase
VHCVCTNGLRGDFDSDYSAGSSSTFCPPISARLQVVVYPILCKRLEGQKDGAYTFKEFDQEFLKEVCTVEVSSKVPDVQKLFKQVMADPGSMFELLRIDLKEQAEKVINEMLKAELTSYLGRDRYQPTSRGKGKNYRNGSYPRSYNAKHLGELHLEVPRDRNGEFHSQIVKRYQRREACLERDIALLFLGGFSTRSVELVSKALLGTAVSAGDVSKVTAELALSIEAWRNRDLGGFDVKYLIIDGVNFLMRIGRRVERVPMLVVIGVLRDGHKVFLALQQGTKDAASVWREVFRDLKGRHLNAERIELGIMDGLPGLEAVFAEEFPHAKIQRCQVHVARNVLAKVPQKMRAELADRVRDVFYAPSRQKAHAAFEQFAQDYESALPSAVGCLRASLEKCLTFYTFPEHEWMSLRTTNSIERVNKEFKRRTKPMEVLAGERSAYKLLCFVALKLELTWKNAPLGVGNLPVLRRFTQNP